MQPIILAFLCHKSYLSGIFGGSYNFLFGNIMIKICKFIYSCSLCIIPLLFHFILYIIHVLYGMLFGIDVMSISFCYFV